MDIIEKKLHDLEISKLKKRIKQLERTSKINEIIGLLLMSYVAFTQINSFLALGTAGEHNILRTYQYQDYTVNMVDNCTFNNWVGEFSCWGYTPQNKTIYILADGIYHFYETCVHEVCHNQIDLPPTFEEIACETLDSFLRNEMCDYLYEKEADLFINDPIAYRGG